MERSSIDYPNLAVLRKLSKIDDNVVLLINVSKHNLFLYIKSFINLYNCFVTPLRQAVKFLLQTALQTEFHILGLANLSSRFS